MLCRSEKDPTGFGNRAAPEAKPPAKVKAASEEDRKWKLEPREVSEWLDWVNAQKQAAGVTGGLSGYDACTPLVFWVKNLILAGLST